MFDDDEYFYDKHKRSINEILVTIPENAGQILLPMLDFGHSKQILSAPSCITRLNYFTKLKQSPPSLYVTSKAIVRLANIVNPSIWQWWCCHSATNVNGTKVLCNNCDAEQVDTWTIKVFDFDTCLCHYISGAMEDWVTKYKKWKDSPLECDEAWRQFDFFTSSDEEDTRMSVYADDLIRLLSQCKK